MGYCSHGCTTFESNNVLMPVRLGNGNDDSGTSGNEKAAIQALRACGFTKETMRLPTKDLSGGYAAGRRHFTTSLSLGRFHMSAFLCTV